MDRVVLTNDEVGRHRDALAAKLAESGALRSQPWRWVFQAVPRHAFVPRFWREEPGAYPPRWRMVDSATADYDAWLAAVYSDRTLVTELIGAWAPDGRARLPQVASSATMPSLVATMLEALDVEDGMRVLQVGTGPGYTTALLAERLGADNVTSIDISLETVALAAVRLTAQDYRPYLVAGDGATGVPERAPFDRILATCGFDHLPAEWLRQTRDGGKILVNLHGPVDRRALILLTVRDGVASGRFLPQPGGFSPRRPAPDRPAEPAPPPVSRRTTSHVDYGHSRLNPRTLFTDPTWGILAQWHLPQLTCRVGLFDPDRPSKEHLGTELSLRDGSSWALVGHTPDAHGYPTEQVGPRRLWAELERMHARWTEHGCPHHDRFGLTIRPDTPPVLWLDQPGRTEWVGP